MKYAILLLLLSVFGCKEQPIYPTQVVIVDKVQTADRYGNSSFKTVFRLHNGTFNYKYGIDFYYSNKIGDTVILNKP